MSAVSYHTVVVQHYTPFILCLIFTETSRVNVWDMVLYNFIDLSGTHT